MHHSGPAEFRAIRSPPRCAAASTGLSRALIQGEALKEDTRHRLGRFRQRRDMTPALVLNPHFASSSVGLPCLFLDRSISQGDQTATQHSEEGAARMTDGTAEGPELCVAYLWIKDF
jgi:hypothetical protein